MDKKDLDSIKNEILEGIKDIIDSRVTQLLTDFNYTIKESLDSNSYINRLAKKRAEAIPGDVFEIDGNRFKCIDNPINNGKKSFISQNKRVLNKESLPLPDTASSIDVDKMSKEHTQKTIERVQRYLQQELDDNGFVKNRHVEYLLGKYLLEGSK